MKAKHKMLFLVLLFILIGIVVFRFLHNNDELLCIRTKDTNPAETIVLKGPNKYEVGEKKFKPGFYDVESTEDIDTNLFKVGKSQKVVSQELVDTNVLTLSEGKVLKLNPSKFKPLYFKNGVAKLTNTMGYFQCGTELEEGSYAISLNIENKDAKLYIQKKDSDSNILQARTIINEDIENVTLINGDFLDLIFLDTKSGDFVINIVKK